MNKEVLNFACDGCGLCCKNITTALNKIRDNKLHVLYKLAMEFPYNGVNDVCEKLDQVTNKCTVYDNRPDICNLEKSYDSVKSFMSKKDWFRNNMEGCDYLKRQNNIKSMTHDVEELRDKLDSMLLLYGETERNDGVSVVLDHMFNFFDSNSLSEFTEFVADEEGYTEDDEEIDEDEDGETVED